MLLLATLYVQARPFTDASIPDRVRKVIASTFVFRNVPHQNVFAVGRMSYLKPKIFAGPGAGTVLIVIQVRKRKVTCCELQIVQIDNVFR